jgi:hypothetical protein
VSPAAGSSSARKLAARSVARSGAAARLAKAPARKKK